jgi:ATP-dependent DNA helicase RecG
MKLPNPSPSAKREHQQVEWKESWRDEYLKWICGFANSEGGLLVIGRNDKGAVVGVADAPKLLEDLPNKVRDALGILVDVNLRSEVVSGSEREYLEIVVEPYPYPVSYKGQYHVRSGSTKQELKGAALDRFLLRKVGLHWDGVPVPHVSVADLDGRALARFRQLATRSQRVSAETLQEGDATLIDKLHLLEGTYLKRAALLLFHPDPERYFTGAYVKIGFFANNVDLLYHDEIHGDLFTQVDKTLDLLLSKYMRALISYEGVQRVETYPVPEVALREAVLNAIAHKDYASGAPIQISVYDDKLMLWNPGHLPPGWSVERLTGKHSSQPCNPDVANAFFRAGMIESWGRGIERVQLACRQAGVPEPEWRVEQTGLWAEFHYPAMSSAAAPVEAPVETPVETPVEAPVKTAARVLERLHANPQATLAEVAAEIGMSLRAVERASAKLVKDGRLLYVGPRKGGHWKVL